MTGIGVNLDTRHERAGKSELPRDLVIVNLIFRRPRQVLPRRNNLRASRPGSSLLRGGRDELAQSDPRIFRIKPDESNAIKKHAEAALQGDMHGRADPQLIPRHEDKHYQHALSALSIRPHFAPSLALLALCSAQVGDIPRAKAALADPRILEGTKAGILGRLLHYNPKWDEQVRLTLERVQPPAAAHQGSLPK